MEAVLELTSIVRGRSRKGSPRIVRIIILFQTALIILLAGAMYREYSDNFYLREYMAGLAQASLTPELVFGLILLAAFGSGTFTLTVAWRYGKSISASGLPRTPKARSLTGLKSESAQAAGGSKVELSSKPAVVTVPKQSD